MKCWMGLILVMILGFRAAWGGINEWTYVGLAPEIATDVAVHPSSPDRIYVSALDLYADDSREGGFFGTTDHGRSWDTLGFRHSSVFDIDMNPVHPERLWIAAGLAGVFETMDGGATWNDRSANLPLGTADNYSAVAVAANPANPADVIVSARGDMGPGWTYRTTDGGMSWRNLHPWLTMIRIIHDTLVAGRVYVSAHNSDWTWISDDFGSSFRHLTDASPWGDVAPDPSQPNGLWILRSERLVYTPDTGATWIEPDSTFPPPGETGRFILASPRHPSEIYASTTTQVFRSGTGGHQWSALASGLPGQEVRMLSLVSPLPAELWLSDVGGGLYAYTVADSGNGTSEPPAVLSRPLCVYPNPSRGGLWILGLTAVGPTVQVFNVLGQQVAVLPLTRDSGRYFIHLPAGLAAGKYFGLIDRLHTSPQQITFTVSK